MRRGNEKWLDREEREEDASGAAAEAAGTCEKASRVAKPASFALHLGVATHDCVVGTEKAAAQ